MSKVILNIALVFVLAFSNHCYAVIFDVVTKTKAEQVQAKIEAKVKSVATDNCVPPEVLKAILWHEKSWDSNE